MTIIRKHLKIVNMINFNNRTFSVVLFTNSEGWAKAAASRSAKTKKLFSERYGRGSTASRLEPLRKASLVLINKFPDNLGTHFIDLGRMQD